MTLELTSLDAVTSALCAVSALVWILSVVLAVTATGDAKFTCCQPLAVSPANVARPRFVPVLLHRLPMCVPVLVLSL